MRFRSARDDLEEVTLAAVPGLVARLRYLAGLREEDGRYRHWGLAKLHGEEEAEEALERAHREVTARLLRQPLAELYAEAEDVAGALEQPAERLLPGNADALVRAHFSSVWDALASVARRRRSRLPAA